MKGLVPESPVSSLKGIGPKKQEVLEASGVHNLLDLLYYLPRRHLDRNLTENVLLASGQVITVLVEILDSYLAHGRRTRLIVGSKTSKNERVSLVFFKGTAYFKKVFQPGMQCVVTGRLEYFRGFQIIHPEFEILSGEEEEDLIHSGRIIPLYPSGEELKKAGLDSKGFRKLIHEALQAVQLPEILPASILKKRKLKSRQDSVWQIHFPEEDSSLDAAKRYLKYEELFLFYRLVQKKKEERKILKRKLWPLPTSRTADTLLSNLPFQLTSDQIKSMKHLKELGAKEEPFAVLLQGDVGSGKTLVALLTALHYIDNRIQVCFLAPTEILARQHYQTAMRFLGNMPFMGIDLLVGKEPKKNRLQKLQSIKSGDTSMVFGTHSVFQRDVEFQDLGFVIIDEQHKFGVEQRQSLIDKGKNPDVLAMTATPIPRTLCLTVYGDSELITIKSKPKGRQDIQTMWFGEERRSGVYNSIRKYVSQGRQCYIVYPLVEESEKSDLQSCIEAYEKLISEIFPEFRVELLHGKMNTQDKERVMKSFQSGESKILVSTTVVEVGVDVPNATVMVIEHADRFGISQLHQLRGRVGRGEHESFCILMAPPNVSPEAEIRLQAMTQTNDGFLLAETDLKLRGPGELLGVRQSGMPEFQIADLRTDSDIIEEVREDIDIVPKATSLELAELERRFPTSSDLISL